MRIHSNSTCRIRSKRAQACVTKWRFEQSLWKDRSGFKNWWTLGFTSMTAKYQDIANQTWGERVAIRKDVSFMCRMSLASKLKKPCYVNWIGPPTSVSYTHL